MTISPTLQPTFHNEFHLENSEVESRCCFLCWKSKPKKPHEYIVNDKDEIEPKYKKCNHRTRIIANERLARLIKSEFDTDPISNDEAFERLTKMINDPLNNGDPITSERLEKIISAIYKLKIEFIKQHEEVFGEQD